MYKNIIIPWEQEVGNHGLKGKDLDIIVVEMLIAIKKDGTLFEAIESEKNDMLEISKDFAYCIPFGKNIADKLLTHWKVDYLPLDNIIHAELIKRGIDEDEALDMLMKQTKEIEIIWNNFKWHLQNEFVRYFTNGRPTLRELGIEEFKADTTFGFGFEDNFPYEAQEFTMEFFNNLYKKSETFFLNLPNNKNKDAQEQYKMFVETIEEYEYEATNDNYIQFIHGYLDAFKNEALKLYYNSYLSAVE